MVWRAAFLFFLSVAAMPTASAQGIEPHELYERHCARCHAPHAGDFVSGNLERRDGQIVGRKSGIALGAYLAKGHGRLAVDRVPEMLAHLTTIFDAGGLFRRHCRICHERGVVLARRELLLRDGRVVGRYSGRDIRAFLENHGRLDGDEIETVMRMLKRQLETAK